eukprot:2525855-Rhodomonas_salina.2
MPWTHSKNANSNIVVGDRGRTDEIFSGQEDLLRESQRCEACAQRPERDALFHLTIQKLEPGRASRTRSLS